jgi:hypothetical protein
MSNNGELDYLRETFPAWSIEQSEDGWAMQHEGSARVLHAKTLPEPVAANWRAPFEGWLQPDHRDWHY